MSQLNAPTDEEIEAALHKLVWENEGMWWFLGSSKGRSHEEARGIVEACLRLGVRPTDVITAQGWVALVRAVTALDERVARLELWAEEDAEAAERGAP